MHQEGLDALSPLQICQNYWPILIEAKRSFSDLVRLFASGWPAGCRLKRVAVALRYPRKLFMELTFLEGLGVRQIGPDRSTAAERGQLRRTA